MSDLPAVFPPTGFIAVPSVVEGVEVYAPAQQNSTAPDVVDFKCPRCGATTAYNLQAAALTCEHCGYAENTAAQPLGSQAERFEFKVETLARSQQGWGTARKELACQNCGALLSTPPDIITYTCPFCASNKVLLREPLQDVLRPRFLIPFQMDPQACQASVHHWLGSSWMTPAALRQAAKLERLHPIYLPYWTFCATARAQWKAQVGREVREYYYVNGERHERTRIEWRWEGGNLDKSFTDLLVPGTARLPLGVMANIDNFDVNALVSYEPRLLAGMHALAYDIPLEQAWDAGRQVMRDRTRQTCRDHASTNMVRDFSMTLDFQDETWRYLLVPVYTSVYIFNERPYQVLINGQTGKIAGPRPVDWGKVWLAIAGLLAPGLFLGILGILLMVLQIGILIGGIGLFVLLIGVIISFFIFIQAQSMESAHGS